jgi:hypothetical protein
MISALGQKLAAFDSRPVFYLAYFLLACCCVLFYTTVMPHFRPYPYSDDWIFPWALDLASPVQFINWVFAPHVDHRIPIQKLWQFLVLRETGFDFRYVIAVNYACACLMSVLLLESARLYRGRRSFGDLIIPLGVLNLGADYSNWAFQFQFLASSLFASGFIFLVLLYVKGGTGGRRWQLNTALACVLLTALNGINGMIMSTVLSACMVAHCAAEYRSKKGGYGKLAYLLLALDAIVNILLWLNWTPSSVTVFSQVSAGKSIDFLYHLLPAGFIFYALEGVWWKFILILALTAAAAWVLLRKLRGGQANLADFALASVAVGTVGVMWSIAIGRSTLWDGWDPDITLHYGFLTILLPLASWIVLSAQLRTRWSAAIGLALVVLFARAYQFNADLRYETIAVDAAHQAEVLHYLATEPEVKAVTAKYMLDFCWIDTPFFRRGVEHGMQSLREHGEPLYGPQSASGK